MEKAVSSTRKNRAHSGDHAAKGAAKRAKAGMYGGVPEAVIIARLALKGFARMFDTNVASAAAGIGNSIRTGDNLSEDGIDLIFDGDAVVGGNEFENQSDSDKTESITFNSATYGYYVAFLEFQLTALAKDGTTVHDIESPPFRIEVVGQEPVNYKIQSKRGHLKLAFDKIASSVDTFNVTIPQADDAGIKWSLQVTGYGEKPDLEYMTDVASGATTAAELAEPSVAAQLNESVLAKPAMKSATAALKSAVDSIDAENIVENALTALGGSHGTGGTRKAVRTQRSAQTTRRSGSGSSTVITK